MGVGGSTLSGGGDDAGLRRVRPYLTMSLIGVALAAVPVDAHHVRIAAFGLGVTLALAVVCARVPWSSLPDAWLAGPPLAWLAIVGALRELDGGTESGFGPLVLISVVWLALHGTRRQVWWSVVGTAAVFVVPILTSRATEQALAWRIAVVWTLAVAVVGHTINQLVGSVRRREARLRTLLANLPDSFVVVVDDELRLSDACAPASGHFGAGIRDIVGHRLDEADFPAPKTDLRPHWQAALAGTPQRLEAITPDGRLIEVAMAPLPADDGVVAEVVGIIRDMEQHTADAERTVARLQAELAFAHAPFGAALIDGATGRWVSVNDSLRELLGFTKDELVGELVLDLVHPDDREDGPAGVADLVDGPGVHSTRRRLRRADGTFVPTRMTVRVHQDRPRGPIWEVAHIEDLREHLAFEDALAATEARSRRILSSLHEGIMLYDESGVLREWNEALPRVYGLTEAQLARKEPFPEGYRLLHPDGTPMLADETPSALVLADGKPRIGMRIGIEWDGRPVRWFNVNCLPLRGEGLKAVSSIVDDTDRLAAEREVQLTSARFAALIEHSADLLVVFDPDRTLTYASQTWERLLGWDPATSTSEEIAERIHPDDLPRLFAAIDAALEGGPGTVVQAPHRIIHADGSWRHLETTFTNLLENEAVRGIVGNSRDVTEQVEAERRLTELAMHDGLTGLPNRRFVLSRLEEALQQQRRSGGDIAVLFVDLDNLKGINDAYGHAAGDELLVAVAQRLSGCVRVIDTVGRLGGDEFVIVAALTTPDGAEIIAGHIDAAMAEEVRLSDGMFVEASASVGVVVGTPEDAISAERLLAQADSAMYAIKQRRRRR